MSCHCYGHSDCTIQPGLHEFIEEFYAVPMGHSIQLHGCVFVKLEEWTWIRDDGRRYANADIAIFADCPQHDAKVCDCSSCTMHHSGGRCVCCPGQTWDLIPEVEERARKLHDDRQRDKAEAERAAIARGAGRRRHNVDA